MFEPNNIHCSVNWQVSWVRSFEKLHCLLLCGSFWPSFPLAGLNTANHKIEHLQLYFFSSVHLKLSPCCTAVKRCRTVQDAWTLACCLLHGRRPVHLGGWRRCEGVSGGGRRVAIAKPSRRAAARESTEARLRGRHRRCTPGGGVSKAVRRHIGRRWGHLRAAKAVRKGLEGVVRRRLGGGGCGGCCGWRCLVLLNAEVVEAEQVDLGLLGGGLGLRGGGGGGGGRRRRACRRTRPRGGE